MGATWHTVRGYCTLRWVRGNAKEHNAEGSLMTGPYGANTMKYWYDDDIV